jgi:hypothetical protein
MGSYPSKPQPTDAQELLDEKYRGHTLVDQLSLMDIGGKPASADGSLTLGSVKSWEADASKVGVWCQGK